MLVAASWWGGAACGLGCEREGEGEGARLARSRDAPARLANLSLDRTPSATRRTSFLALQCAMHGHVAHLPRALWPR
jgi:hypothetical protein